MEIVLVSLFLPCLQPSCFHLVNSCACIVAGVWRADERTDMHFHNYVP